MRIYTAVRHSINPKFYYGELWSSNFYLALKQLGHVIIQSEIDLLPASQFMQIGSRFTREELAIRERITAQIIEEVKKANNDQPIALFLSYFYNAHFDPAGFDEIHRMGIPTVNFYCNSLYQFDLVDAIAPKVMFAWHTEKHARQLYLNIGTNPVWVQMGADPNVYFPLPNTYRQTKACFVGQRYADRDRWVAALIRADVPMDIYGSGWGQSPSTHIESTSSENLPSIRQTGRKIVRPGSLSSYIDIIIQNLKTQGLFTGGLRSWKQLQFRRESQQLASIITPHAKGRASSVAETFADYEVILNFSNVWSDGRPGSNLIPHVRLRDFEAPMCRACYLTGYTDEIEEFYEVGNEIDTYASVDELVDKVKFYLSHPTAAERLREAGYQRARKEHTWINRFEELFQKINLD